LSNGKYISLGGVNQIVWGDARTLLSEIDDASIDPSFWSSPYFVGKSYEKDWSFDDWCELL
jgi:site-specific DNA-methyltransferase (adenine-specific)